jgi:uncharacterized protein YcbX
MQIGTVARLFRYPVKSMRGEEIASTEIGLHGLAGDRRWSFVQARDRSVFPWLTARRAARMLLYQPRYAEEPIDSPREPRLSVETPDGRTLAVDDDALRAELAELAETPLYLLHTFRGVPDVAPLSIFNLALANAIGSHAGAELDPRRFRANVYVEPSEGGYQDSDLVGRTLAIGTALRVAVLSLDERCKMIGLDPVSAEADPRVVRTVVTSFANCAGIYCAVLRAGRASVGDAVSIE